MAGSHVNLTRSLLQEPTYLTMLLSEDQCRTNSAAGAEGHSGTSALRSRGLSSDRLNTARAAEGACLGSGLAKFECILYGLRGLGGSPEG